MRVIKEGLPSGAGMPTFHSQHVTHRAFRSGQGGHQQTLAQTHTRAREAWLPGTQVPQHVRPRSPIRRRRRANSGLQPQPGPSLPSAAGNVVVDVRRGSPASVASPRHAHKCLSIRTDDLGSLHPALYTRVLPTLDAMRKWSWTRDVTRSRPALAHPDQAKRRLSGGMV